MAGDLGDEVERDPEVRQARMVAEAARTRLLACVSGPRDAVDLAEAQRMLDACGSAMALADDVEDLVLVRHGLLTESEAARRAARRHPAPQPEPPGPVRGGLRPGRLRPGRAARRAGAVVAIVAAVFAAVAVARRLGWRPDPLGWR